MIKINKICSVAIMASSLLVWGCNDGFLQDKKNYGSVTDELYNDYQGALGRIDFLYYNLLPNSTAGINFDTPSAGTADDYAKSTEEYGGFSDYVNPNVNWDNTTVPDYIYRENKNVSPYGRIRECNNIIAGIQNSTLNAEQKKELIGQAYFFRAWCYYRLVKIYGGVPIVDKVQNPILGNGGGAELVVPRNKTIDCINFICEDLKKASESLPARWANESVNFGRVTAGTALALMGRARLLYASPLFNRADDETRWTAAYDANKAAIAKLTEGGFGLAYLAQPGKNASGWAKMFSDYTSTEAVFVTLYNTIKTSPGTSYNKNNAWESSIRPKNIQGGGGKGTTAQMVDLFPMADGKRPGQSPTYAYQKNDLNDGKDGTLCFFLNRDPRFYRTFAFPGVRWAFSGDLSAMNSSNPVQYPYASGATYPLWSYVWYANQTKLDADDQSGFAADGLGTSNTSVYVRKRTDDLDVNDSPLYKYDNTDKFALSAAPYMEMRYAEVLLNFAESACGANHSDEALEALREIRRRVGYTGDCGLDESLAGDRAKLFEAILYERQIELAYEGKRFDDMRRWMLWDGGLGQEAINATWRLTGFSGNTCTYLGVAPFNGQRRVGIEIASLALAPEADGLANDKALATRPAPLNLKNDNVLETELQTSPIDLLATFYTTNFKRKSRRIDGDKSYSIKFKPTYYIIGFKTNMQKMNSTLKQTIGWPDFMNGNAPGTFDPLAE